MMEFEFSNIQIRNENDLIMLVEQINHTNRENSNMKPLDMKRILYLYRRIKRKDEIAKFRLEHDCKNCYFFQEKTCHGINQCRMEDITVDKRRGDERYEQDKEEISDG